MFKWYRSVKLLKQKYRLTLERGKDSISFAYLHHIQYKYSIYKHASSFTYKGSAMKSECVYKNWKQCSWLVEWSCYGMADWSTRVDADENVWFSLSGLFWLSQLVFAPRHPASPSAPLLRCLAPSVPGSGGAALCLLLVLFHHTLPICSPHGLCLLSLLRERNRETQVQRWLPVATMTGKACLEVTHYIYSC